jgi:AraC-like DNA-binding protein
MGSNQEPINFQVKLDPSGSLTRRKTELLADGLFLFEDELKIEGVLRATIVTCRAWLLELYDLRAGQLWFTSGKELVYPKARRFGILYSPFSICEPYFKEAAAHLVGIAATNSLPAEFNGGPILFDSTFTRPPSNLEQLLEALKAGNNRQSIDLNPNPSLLSLKAKKLIDKDYLTHPSISGIAARLGVTPEHLSRQFKCDFRMSPRNYLRQLRVADAPLRLAKGEEIVNVSQDVGYSDLSRFYKQFRKTTDTSPGACKTILWTGHKR